MEIIPIAPAQDKLWENVWQLYTSSFPQHERRSINSHRRACENPDFHTCIACEEGNLLALLFYWKHLDMIYLEHLAVNPLLRGNNIGTSLLQNFINQNPQCKIILEIDPPIDEISKNRLHFYERIGFKLTDYPYTHPSYAINGKVHPLRILSYPEAIAQPAFNQFVNYMKNTVLAYID